MKENITYSIGVDARPLSTSITGVGRLITETIREFPKHNNYHFYLFSHNPIHPEHANLLQLKNVTWVQGKGFFAKKGGLYFNFHLPFQFKNYSLDLFWGSQQVIPPFLPKKIPVVLTYYDFVLYFYPDTMRKIAAMQQKMFQKLSITRANHIISISEQTKTDLLRLFSYPKEHASVAYPGINLGKIQELCKKPGGDRIDKLPKKYFLSVSTIEPRKNYPFLLKAYQSYRNLAGNEKIPWIIAGKVGWEKEGFIESLKEESRKYQDIILFKSPSDIELHHLYKNATAFLFASFYEGFGIPLLEALAHHRPSLVADIPTFHEIGKDQITYLPTQNESEWAKAMLELQKSSFRPSIPLEDFTWQKSATHVEAVFQKLLLARKQS